MSARDERDWGAAPKLPASHFVSGTVYTDPAIYADEVRELFGRLWRFACHESELPNAFDYRVFDHAGQSLFCIRGADDRIRTFINVCSHRGAKLLSQPRGNGKTITCFYHRWTYDANGSCTGIPRPAGYSANGPSRNQMGLREVRTEIKFGLVFINLDDAAVPLDEFLDGALDSFAAPLGSIPLEVFHYNRTELESNWKAWHETNLDIYHENMHVVLRKTQLNAMPMEDRILKLFGNGHGASGELKAQYDGYEGFAGRGDDVPPLPGLTGTDFRFIDLFPSTTILLRGTAVRIDTATPLAPGKTLLEMRGLGIKGESTAHRQTRTNHHNQYWGPFGRNVPEDTFAAEACADSFRNGAARYQIISREEGLAGQDDAILRTFYAEWGRRLNRLPSDPSRDWVDGD
jgi:methanesulfonate monooxygenase large subunit